MSHWSNWESHFGLRRALSSTWPCRGWTGSTRRAASATSSSRWSGGRTASTASRTRSRSLSSGTDDSAHLTTDQPLQGDHSGLTLILVCSSVCAIMLGQEKIGQRWHGKLAELPNWSQSNLVSNHHGHPVFFLSFYILYTFFTIFNFPRTSQD